MTVTAHWEHFPHQADVGSIRSFLARKVARVVPLICIKG